METSAQVETIKSLLSNYSKRTKAVGQKWCDLYNLEEKDRFKLVGGRQRTLPVVQSVARKVKENPFKKGLSRKEYETMIGTWIPNVVCKFDGIHNANVEGSAEALSVVLTRYPTLGLRIKGYGSVAGFRSHNKGGSVDAAKIEKEIRESEEWKQKCNEFIESELNHKIYNRPEKIIRRWKMRRTGELKDWLELHGYWSHYDDKIREILRKRLSDVFFSKAVEKEVAKRKKEIGDLPNVKVPTVKGALGFYWEHTKCVYMTARGKEDYTPVMGYAEAGEFHPVVDKDQSGSKQVMMHELGHALDACVGGANSIEIMSIWNKTSRKEITAGLSKYASTNIEEMIAEAFCEYYCSSNPRPLAKSIVEIINKLYDQQLKRIESGDEQNYGAKE